MPKTIRKDWALVIVLVAVLIACVGGQLWIRPVREKIEKAETRIESLEEKCAALQSDQNSYRLRAARYQELMAEADALAAFLPSETTAAELEKLIGGLFRDAGLTVQELTLSGPDVHTVPSLLEGKETQETSVQTFTLSYRASGTYDELLALCKSLQEYDYLAVSSMDFSVPSDEEGLVDIQGKCDAEITLTAYQLRRMVFTTEETE